MTHFIRSGKNKSNFCLSVTGLSQLKISAATQQIAEVLITSQHLNFKKNKIIIQ
jgi:hypothetical protein